MSIVVQFDYKLADGSIREKIRFFTMGYGSDVVDIPTQRSYIRRCFFGMLEDWKEAKEKPELMEKRPWLNENIWFKDARYFRMSDTEAWYEIWKEEK